MNVISRNPFDLLGDNDEAPAPVAAPKAAPAAAPKVQRDIPGSGNNNRSAGARGGRGGSRGARNGERSDRNKESAVDAVDPEAGFEGERRDVGRSDRGSARPRGGDRGRDGRGRGRGQTNRATTGEKHNAGRRSAHALPDSEKRVASGWGAEDGQTELIAEVEGAGDASKEIETQTPAEPAANGGRGDDDATPAEPAAAGWDAGAPAAAGGDSAAQNFEQKPEEEVDNTKTYEEYLADQKSSRDAKLGKLEGRTVEGSEELVGSAFQRKEEEFFSGAKKEKAAAAKKEKERKEKVFIEVEGRFAPPARGERSDRGDREGGRGRGGGRGGFRGDRGGSDRPRGGASTRGGRDNNRNDAKAPAVSDESAFPALGA